MSGLLRQVVRYGGTSALSACISLGLPALMHEVLGVPERYAVLITLVAVFAFNFFALRRAVFQTGDAPVARQSGSYLVVSLTFRALEYLAFLALFDLAGVHYLVSVLIVQAVSTVLKFFAYRSLVFRPAAPADRANSV